MTIDSFGKTWYKVGLHLHTTLSDGHVSPERAAEIYKTAGFDAIAITDHWHYGEEQELDGLKILSGCEYDLGGRETDRNVMHIVGVGMRYAPRLKKKAASRQETVDCIREAGGYAFLAHPAWSLNTPEQAEAISGFSAVEIYNTVSAVEQSDRPYSGYFIDLLANRGTFLPPIATDDAHYYKGQDEAKSYIMVNCEALTAHSIFSAVEQGRFYASQGPELYVRMENNRLLVDCTPCRKICIFSNIAWCPDRVSRGDVLTHKEYEPKEHERWLRVEVADNAGRCAWSRFFVLA